MSRRPVLCLALAELLIWACIYYSFPALLLDWEAAFGWSRAELTGALTLAVLVSALCSPVYGRLIDAGHGPVMMTGAALLAGICLLALTRVETLAQFYLAWGVLGVCMAGSMYEPCFALITRARGADARRAITLVTLIAGFAGSLSFPLAHTLAEAWGWRGAVGVFGAVAILGVAPLMWIGAHAIERQGRTRATIAGGQGGARRAFLRGAVFWLLAIAFGLVAVVHGVTLHHLLPILDERALPAEVAVVAVSFIGPMQVAGRLAMMAAERHLSNHGIAVACFVLLGGSIVLLTGAGASPALLVGFVILFGGAYGVVSIIRPLIARDLLGERHFGAKSGALALVFLAGSAAAPYLGSLAWARVGYGALLPALVGVAAVGLGLYLAACRAGAGSPVDRGAAP